MIAIWPENEKPRPRRKNLSGFDSARSLLQRGRSAIDPRQKPRTGHRPTSEVTYAFFIRPSKESRLFWIAASRLDQGDNDDFLPWPVGCCNLGDGRLGAKTSRSCEERTKALGSNTAIRRRPASAFQRGSAFRCPQAPASIVISRAGQGGAGASRSYDGLVSSR